MPAVRRTTTRCITCHLSPRPVFCCATASPSLLVVSFVALAAAAAIDDDGSVLLAFDRSVTTALHDVRSEPLDLVVQTFSGLGGLTVVVALLVVLLLIVWHQCRALALTLLVATAARPLLEWALEEAVDRARPDIAQLVPGNGPSFPSGHVMAAVAAWGLLPPVVALVTGRRSAWWWSVGLSGAASSWSHSVASTSACTGSRMCWGRSCSVRCTCSPWSGSSFGTTTVTPVMSFVRLSALAGAGPRPLTRGCPPGSRQTYVTAPPLLG